MTGVRFETVSADEDGMRLDRWFKLHAPQISFGELNRLARKGQIRVGGKRVKSSTRVTSGDEVRIPPTGDQPKPQHKQTPVLSEEDAAFLQSLVLYEDRDLMVLNKPSGIAVQGGSKTKRHIDGLLAGLAGKNEDRPRLVHRLDRDTSGVLVVAKRRSVAAALGKQFQTRSVHKFYWAAVAGVPDPLQGKISMPLVKAPGKFGEMVRPAEKDDKAAQACVTHYAVIDRLADKLAWVSLKPVTGRQHQLRAHMSFTGTPILGDGKYGGNEELPDDVEVRLHLHARRIRFAHPRGTGTVDVTAPLPEHMQKSWSLFGFDPARYDIDPDTGEASQ